MIRITMPFAALALLRSPKGLSSPKRRIGS